MKNITEIRPVKDLRLTYFIYGAFFLFNPFVTVVDALPDFIGALFFILALYKIRDLSDHLNSSRTNFIRFFWVSASRIPAFFLMFWVSHNFSAERSIMLVFTFCYAVAETIMLAISFNQLFNGLIYIGERNDGSAVFHTVKTVKKDGYYEFAKEEAKDNYNRESTRKKRRPQRPPMSVSAVKTLSIVTFLLLRALSVLPELVYIADNGDVLSATQKVAPIHFKGIFTVLAFIPALALGIIWLKRFTQYMRGVCADNAFCTNLLRVYNERMPRDSKVHDYRRFSRFCVFAVACVILALDFFVDDVNAVPDFFASALMLSGVLYYNSRIRRVPAFAIFATGAAVLLDIFSIITFSSFTSDFIFSDVWRVDEATSAYILYIAADSLATAALTFSAVFLAVNAFNYVKSEMLNGEHAGASPRIKNEIRDLKRKSVIASAFTVVSAVSNVFYRLALADTESIAVTDQRFTDSTHLYIPKLEIYWMVDFAISLILIAAAFAFVEKLKDCLKYKYMIED